uniref:Terpene synthase N-terminal domain-containing protein n=1 Tax=Oryza barthii TaxID=65489 RepID=A0A0D3FUD9_9ORYZ
MNLVDAVQRLGIAHLFEDEINHTLSDIYQSEFTSSSIHEVALRFRLLREHGLWVSPDAFNKFKGDDGRFIDGVANEPRGLLSLYNAAYLLVHDEPELEEAISFSRHHLTSMMQGKYLKHPLVDQVSRALHLPLTRTRKRVETLCYFSEYQQEDSYFPMLLDLAKLEFNLLQGSHLKELEAISMNVDATCLSQFQKLSHYYLQEAEWLHNNHKPSFQEQVALSTLTSTVQLVCVSSTVGRGDTITKEAFEWAASSTAITACAKIMRLKNDIAAFKRGKNKGDIASSVECYMNEHKVNSEVAITELSSLIEDEWRTMNQARYKNREILPAVQRVMNYGASIMLFYDNRKDAYTFSSHLHEIVKSLFFVKSIPL